MRVLLAAAVAAVLATPAPAHADIFVSPFLGLKFKGATNELDFGDGAGDAKLSIGASAPWSSATRARASRRSSATTRGSSRRGTGDLVSRSGVTTLFGNFLLALPDQHHPRVAAPLRRRRPRLGTRLGQRLIGFNAVSNDFLGLALGGGAIGFVSDTAGLRFDIRYLKSVSSADVSDRNQESAGRISFWRATVGVVFR